MIDRVLKTISRYNMLGPPGRSGVLRVAVAVSGGPDSVCLLQLLTECAQRLGITLSVAHFNHKLRGAASDADERFVAELAAGMGLTLHRAEAASTPPVGNLEQFTRNARREFFRRLIREGAADRIALGHTRDDQAETVLFRILRGSGPAGLAGVLPVTAEGCIRPLLEVTRAEVKKFLDARGIAWRFDATNLDPRFARNRIRHDLLPQLAREWNPQVAEGLAQLANLAYDEERWWRRAIERRADTYLAERAGGIEFRASQMAAVPRAIGRRLIRLAIGRLNGDLRGIRFGHVEQVLELTERDAGEGRICLPDLEVIRSFDWVRIARLPSRPALAETAVTIPGTVLLGAGEPSIRFEAASTPCARLKVAELSLGQLPSPMKLRGWRRGDRYRPVGHERDRKIHELFQRARVPSWRRAEWPIVTGGGKILWARQFGPAAEFAAIAGQGPVLRIFETGAEERKSYGR